MEAYGLKSKFSVAAWLNTHSPLGIKRGPIQRDESFFYLVPKMAILVDSFQQKNLLLDMKD